MSFETVSEGSRSFRKTASSPKPHLNPEFTQLASCMSDFSEEAHPESRHLQINTYQKKLREKGLFGWPYVKDYLSGQKRRNCRPSTIQTSFITLVHLLLISEDERSYWYRDYYPGRPEQFYRIRTGPRHEAH